MGVDLVSIRWPKIAKKGKIYQEKGKIAKNGGMEYEKSMFPHDIKGITFEYQLLMHR